MKSELVLKAPVSWPMGAHSRLLTMRLFFAAHAWMHYNVGRCRSFKTTSPRLQLQCGRYSHGGSSSSAVAAAAVATTERKKLWDQSNPFLHGGWSHELQFCASQDIRNHAVSIVGGSRGLKSKAGSRTRRAGEFQSWINGKISQPGDAKNIDWWEERMSECQKSSTKELIKRLVSTNLLGVDSSLRLGSLKEGSIAFELLEIKRRFPHEVILCRIGEFYESIGFDACLLVEHAGLNPMGGVKTDSIPKAGCPIVNLRQTLDDLTRNGFSVCIVEEVKGPSNGRQRKDRFVAGHAHPGSPYVYGLAEADLDVDFPDPIPVVGVARSALGYCFISAVEMMRTVSVEEQLTEEAVVAKLRAKPYQRLFLHRSLRDSSTETVRWGEFGEGGSLWAECRGKQLEWYERDPISELLARVRELYDLESGVEFRRIVAPPGERPRALYVGTASQVGILPTQGVPSLLRVLLPRDSNALCIAYLRDLLLNPPPFRVAGCIQSAIGIASDMKCSIPDFTCVSAAKLVKLIGAREANHIEFARVKNMAEDVLQMEKDPQSSALLGLLLDPTWLATGLRIGRDQLLQDCTFFVQRLDEVLAPSGDPSNVISKNEHVPDDFFQDMEVRWRGRVRRELVEQAYSEIDCTAADLSKALEEDFRPIVLRTRALTGLIGGGSASARAEIAYSRENRSVWLKGRRFVPSVWGGTPGEEEIKRLKPALDSKGKKAGDEWYTTERVEIALNLYRSAVENAAVAVLETLKGIADELQCKLNAVVFVATISIIAKTLFAHVSEAKRRRWVAAAAPTDPPGDTGNGRTSGQLRSGDDRQRAVLHLEDMFPYWLDKTREEAVLNTLHMSSMFLLTGPNGGGKSSILRSVCATALLATCGLMVPCRLAVVPALDSIMLRMMISDSPADGKSSFQMEMSELRTLASEATSKSLVLYDELCKGTEVNKGTFIVASVLEHLDHVGCLGVISTHLHGLLDMQLNVKNVVRKAMAAELVNGHVKPTWKLVDGECRESLAFETARKEGVPDSIVNRAEQFYRDWKSSFLETEHCKDVKMPLYADVGTPNNAGFLVRDHGLASSEATPTSAELDPSCSVNGAGFGHVSTTLNGRVCEDLGLPKFEKAPDGLQNLAPEMEGLSRSIGSAAFSGFHHLASPNKGFAMVEEPSLSGFQQFAATKHMSLTSSTPPLRKLDVSVDAVTSASLGPGRAGEDPIEQAFVSICKQKLVDLCQLQGPNMDCDLQCFYVGPRQKPPPMITNRSCVYILQRPDGKYYVGQTDNMSGRITAHRTVPELEGAPFYYIPMLNKSVACEIETCLINQLPPMGFLLVNRGDQNHRHFGTAPMMGDKHNNPPF